MPLNISVIKRDKSTEVFNPQKVATACLKAGVDANIANEVAAEIATRVYQNIPAHELKKMVFKSLEKHSAEAAEKFWKFEDDGKIVVRNKYV